MVAVVELTFVPFQQLREEIIKVEGFAIQFCYPVATFGTADLKNSVKGDYHKLLESYSIYA